jgi:CRISPR/Cas system-associated exonuclease Cas4 (RecB family)
VRKSKEKIITAGDHYLIGGKRYDRVTSVLEVLGGYEGIPREVLERKAALSKILHNALRAYSDGGLTPSSLDLMSDRHPKLIKPIRFFISWHKENVSDVIFAERTMYSKVYSIAGTPDLIVQMKSGRVAVIDFKMTSEIFPKNHLQTAAYQMIYSEMMDVKTKVDRIIIRFDQDGIAEIKNRPDETYLADKNLYLACVSLHRGIKNLK